MKKFTYDEKKDVLKEIITLKTPMMIPGLLKKCTNKEIVHFANLLMYNKGCFDYFKILNHWIPYYRILCKKY